MFDGLRRLLRLPAGRERSPAALPTLLIAVGAMLSVALPSGIASYAHPTPTPPADHHPLEDQPPPPDEPVVTGEPTDPPREVMVLSAGQNAPSTATTIPEDSLARPPEADTSQEATDEDDGTDAGSSTTTTTELANDGGFDSGHESTFASRISSTREANGVAALSRDAGLDSRARDWARHIGEIGSLEHSNLGALMPPWSSVAENMGAGGSVDQIFDSLVSSSGHLSNMLGEFSHMGVGAWVDGDGTIWTVHLFAG